MAKAVKVTDKSVEAIVEKDCGCAESKTQGYAAPEPYTHTDGKEYLFKAYALRDIDGTELPAKQVFAVAGGAILCEDCLKAFPTLERYVDAEGKDNGKCLAAVNNLFSKESPFLSVIE